jgi:hypothetical protein
MQVFSKNIYEFLISGGGGSFGHSKPDSAIQPSFAHSSFTSTILNFMV